MVVLCAGSFSILLKEKNGISTVKKNKADEPTIIKAIDVEAIIPAVNLDLSHQWFMTSEHPFIIVISYFTTFSETGFVQAFFSKLFPLVISPNAP